MIRNEKTRQFIIEKTAPIFNKKGYVGTYLSELTEATGLTKGSIYGNFADKNEVALEAFRYNYKFQTKDIKELVDQEVTADKKIIAFLNYYRLHYQKIFENGGCAILNTAIDADDGNELLKNEVIDKISAWKKFVVDIVSDGLVKGELINIDPVYFAHYMISMVEGSIMLAKTLKNPQILMDNLSEIESRITASAT